MTVALRDASYARAYLNRVAVTISHGLQAADRLDTKLVALDIAKCRLYADVGLTWARERPNIQQACETLGISENEWSKKKLGRAITTLQGYRQVGREWDRYVTARVEAGENGMTGIDYAKSLVPMIKGRGTNSRNPGDDYERLDISRCTFITDDALSALRKMRTASVDVIPNSPPYYPLRRILGGSFGGKAVGWESTVEQYLDHLVMIFREAKRVLRRRGTVIVVMKDSYSRAHSANYRAHTHKSQRPFPQKEYMPDGTPIQTGDRPPGNLLLIPPRFAMRMQDDGWLLRMLLPVRIIGHPESVVDRTTLDYEWMMIFAKEWDYHWNQDAIREPLAASSRRPHHRTRGKVKDGVARPDYRRDFRVPANPLGRNSGSVLSFRASTYHGKHTATISEALAHWAISAACDDNAVVCDIFGGAGTFALAALQQGYSAITIDIFDEHTKEAIERLSNAPAKWAVGDDNDEGE